MRDLNNMIYVRPTLPMPHAFRDDDPRYGPKRETVIKVVGHSFISGLENRLDDDRIKSGLTLQQQLNLEKHLIKPELLGVRSAYVQDMYDLSEEIDEDRTEALILEIGSNDICKTIPVHMIVARVKGLCEFWLKEIDSLRYIIICQVLFRRYLQRKWSDKTLWQYNADVIQYNRQLKSWIDYTSLPIRYWRHRNLKYPTVRIYGDGVHPNTIDGTWRYQKSIRSAIIMADRYLPL